MFVLQMQSAFNVCFCVYDYIKNHYNKDNGLTFSAQANTSQPRIIHCRVLIVRFILIIGFEF